MRHNINIVHYWGGSPIVATSKWLSTLKLVEECRDHGWNNWLVLSKQPNDPALITPFIDAGCKIVYQPRSKGNFDTASIYRNFNLLRKIKCDIFHCYNDHTSPLIAATLARVPVRVWSKLAMSSYYEQGVAPKGLQKLMISTRVTCSFSTRIFAISGAAGREICEQVGFNHKINIVDVPVALDKFYQATDMGMRDEFNFQQSDIVITAVGHFIEVKGWDVVIKSFSRVKSAIPNAQLLLVGKKTSQEYYDKICSLIKQYDLEKYVTFAGNRSDIPAILKASDLFILPSRSEGAGAVLIEAMATGLPCIATNTGGIADIIVNGENGFLFQRENSAELAEKIINVVSAPELQTKFIASAKQYLHKFSIETHVKNVSFHYENMLQETKN